MPQSITLLNSSILENVAYGLEKKEINQQRVWESIKAAQLEELVDNLPNSLNTQVGEDGIRLSGGQRQRIAIARAIYRESKLLLLDEATSALDNKTESEVMKAIEVIGRRCTIIFIAHRLSTISRADCIYEFENGSIKAYGNYEKLMYASPTFREMISIGREQSDKI